jgi:hypothetical protein
LAAGVKLVWEVHIEARMILLHRADGKTIALKNGDELDGGVALPGFKCKVADIFKA